MEELELKYEVVVHLRTKGHLAPKELQDVWPMGTAPVVQIFKEGSSEPITLAESGHIVQYMIEHYDTKGKLKATTESDKQILDYYLHFAEGSLQPHLVSIHVGNIAVEKSPWGAHLLVKGIMSKINSQYYLKMVLRSLSFLEGQLAKKGGGYFVGDHLTGADILFEFPLYENILNNPDISLLMGSKDLAADYPYLTKWAELIRNEPLRQKSEQIEKDLVSKPKLSL